MSDDEKRMTNKEMWLVALDTVANAINQTFLQNFMYKLKAVDTYPQSRYGVDYVIMNVIRVETGVDDPIVIEDLQITMHKLISDISVDWDSTHHALDMRNHIAKAMVDSKMTPDILHATVLNFYRIELNEYGNLIKQMLTMMEKERGPNSN